MRGANGASLGLGIDSAAAAQLAVAAAEEEDAETAAIATMPFELQHVLWMSYEHEAMHLETLMYLLVQYEAVQPPPAALLADSPSVAWHSGIAAAAAAAAAAVGVDDPSSCRPFCSPGLPGDAAGSTAAQLLPPLPPAAAVVSSPAGQRLLLLPPAASWVQVAPCKVSQGFTPGPTLGSTADVGVVQNNINSSSSSSSSSDVQPLQCGWDNESPAREVSVAGFQVQHRPVTVLEYLHFLAAKLADGLAAGSEATVGSDDGISTCMGTADACPASLGGSEKDTHSCRTSRMQCSSSQADTALGGRPSSTCTAGCIEGLQDRCYPGSPAGSSASSSTNLPRVLAAASDSNQQEAGAGCCRVLQDLLGSPAARGLLPASLALHAAGTACRSGHTEASCTATMASSSSPCSPSGRCSGLCRLHTLPAATSQPASTASPATTQGATSQQQLARTTVLRALQQQLGVKTVFGLTPISIAGYWPIYCSALQAEQYAAWLSEPSQHYRLLTEHELLAARQHNATLGSRSGSAEAFAGSSVQTGVLGSVGVTGTAGGVGSGGSSHASPGCAEPAVASGDAEAFAGSSVSLGVLGSAGVSCSSGRVSSSHAGCAGLATLGVEQGFGQKACWGAGPAAEAPAGDEYESGDSTPEQHWSTISGRGGHTSCSSAAAVSMQSLVTANSMPLGTGFAVWHPLCVALLPSGVAGAAPAAAAGNDAPQQANKEQRCSSVNLPSSGLECSSAVEVSQLCENGWEWTSTVFKRHKGFQANPLYPEYSEVRTMLHVTPHMPLDQIGVTNNGPKLECPVSVQQSCVVCCVSASACHLGPGCMRLLSRLLQPLCQPGRGGSRLITAMAPPAVISPALLAFLSLAAVTCCVLSSCLAGLLWGQACSAAGRQLGHSGQHCRTPFVQKLLPEGAATCVRKVQAV